MPTRSRPSTASTAVNTFSSTTPVALSACMGQLSLALGLSKLTAAYFLINLSSSLRVSISCSGTRDFRDAARDLVEDARFFVLKNVIIIRKFSKSYFSRSCSPAAQLPDVAARRRDAFGPLDALTPHAQLVRLDEVSLIPRPGCSVRGGDLGQDVVGGGFETLWLKVRPVGGGTPGNSLLTVARALLRRTPGRTSWRLLRGGLIWWHVDVMEAWFARVLTLFVKI